MKRLVVGVVIALSALSVTACDNVDKAYESKDEERMRLSKECLEIGGSPKLNGDDDAWAKAQFICERKEDTK